MKKTKHWLVNTLIVILLLVGLTLVFNKPIRNMLMTFKINSYQVSNFSAEQLKNNKKAKGNFNFSQVRAVDFKSVLASQSVQNLPVIGGLAIPELSINLPVFLGVESNQLLFGAGTMKENQVMGQGNYALASHHVFGITGASDLLFSPLQNAKVGMKIYLTDKTNIYQYTIGKVYSVSPQDVAVIEDHLGQNEVTLVTCTDAQATARIIVNGSLSAQYPFDRASKTVLKAFNMKYNQL